ncbi:glycosyltransferase [Paraburkholderia phymatum]|uniref:Glycosyl transferase family 2 n=1 Tax=Paraburkholderia phymatum (strain DSM 17167 / CIP 108236 / LMG 21445 / STM815) TaxID=391038 RepID=B2JT44_PARP8|nr:glycosyltransferase [Paraburkholderia phymatum]ACC75747.1 glycosyl transferase family 2 [Paraburkholderia phymatum STM815]
MSDEGNTYPLVSVYIPTKNRLPLLQRAVASVLQQTYPRIELVVADDGSTDGTREYLDELAASGKCVAVFLPVSEGACAARNAAISMTTGEFLTGLDDDDYFLPQRIECFVQRWRELSTHGRTDHIAGLFDSSRWIGRAMERTLFDRACAHPRDLAAACAVGTQVFSIRERFIAAGLFDRSMQVWQDWDLWLRMAYRYGEFVGIRACTYVIDATHQHERISDRSEAALRRAAQLFAAKHYASAPVQKFRIRSVFVDYPQVRLGLLELAGLLAIGNRRAVGRYLLRKTVGPELYDQIRRRLAGWSVIFTRRESAGFRR